MAFYENPLASKKGARAPQRVDSLTRNIMDDPIPSENYSTNGAGKLLKKNFHINRF
jgi:hypothetical protein